MYKVTVTAGGTTAAAAKCRTKKEAESVKSKLLQLLQMPVSVEITPIGSPR